MRGQVTMETLVTLGMVLAFTVPLILLLFSFTSVNHEETTMAQADASARALSDSLNIVWAQGQGAKRSLLLNLPSSTEEVMLVSASGGPGGEAVVRIKTSEGHYDASAPTIARVMSTHVSSGSGLTEVIVSNENGFVVVRESGEAG